MAIIDLGHGVRVQPLEDSRLEVVSDGLPLPWTARAGDHPGTAVMFDGGSFEVVTSSSAGNETRWELREWVDGEAMRVVLRFDEEEVARLAADAAARRRATGRKIWIWPLAPILALAPARLQVRWRSDWGFPARGATFLSATLEMAVGMLGVVQGLAVVFGGDWFLSGPAKALVILGPIMVSEGVVRLYTVLAADEPMGSVVGLPSLLWDGRRADVRRPMVPRVLRFEPEDGVLELLSTVYRRDWGDGGMLPYHGEVFRLSSVDRHGSDWLYRFDLAAEDEVGERLKLVVWDEAPTIELEPAPNPIRTTLITALSCLASRRFQERWARHLAVRPAWLTVLGSCAELMGGVVNLEWASPGGFNAQLAVNLFFMIEGVTRLALLAVSGRPVGSLLGIPLGPILDRLIPDHDE